MCAQVAQASIAHLMLARAGSSKPLSIVHVYKQSSHLLSPSCLIYVANQGCWVLQGCLVIA